MEFMLIELGPHYGTTTYFTCQGPGNEQQQYSYEDGEITQESYEWSSLLEAMFERVRSAVVESGETAYLPIKELLEGNVYKVMPLLSSLSMSAADAARRAPVGRARLVDPPVRTLEDHERRLKQGRGKK